MNNFEHIYTGNNLSNQFEFLSAKNRLCLPDISVQCTSDVHSGLELIGIVQMLANSGGVRLTG